MENFEDLLKANENFAASFKSTGLSGQAKKGLAMHVCPLQIDIVDRLITRYSNAGDLVYDPFGGLMTVPYRAVKMGRKGKASELNTGYFLDGVQYLKAAEQIGRAHV